MSLTLLAHELLARSFFWSSGDTSKVKERLRVGEVDVDDLPTVVAQRIEVLLNYVWRHTLEKAPLFKVGRR